MIKKLKTFQITLSKTFLAAHPKKGQLTHFLEKVKQGIKKHTIRDNYKYWKNIIDQVNTGTAVLVVKQWSGKPYHSKPIEIFRIIKSEIKLVNFQKGRYKENIHKRTFIEIDGEMLTGGSFDNIARNDGFDLVDDFVDWFPDEIKNGCIIYFTEIKWV